MEIATWKEMVWRQFGAAIDMLENAVRLCPEELWRDRSRYHQLWNMTFHTLFWLDLYLSGAVEGFQPPAPYGLEELDPEGVLPDRVYSKEEMLGYLEQCRTKCRSTIRNLTAEGEARRCRVGSGELSFAELLLYNLRHVQHHAAQLNLLLRLEINDAPRWVGRTDK